jgi:hypothetical protein
MGQANAVLRGKFIVMTASIKRTERLQINYLMLHLKLLEKQEQAKSKISRRREIIKIGPKSMKQTKKRENIQRTIKQRHGSLKK